MKINGNKTRKGTAIIVAMLVMAILLTITLSLSLLTVSEMRQTGDVVAAGKAYYAAEAGVENALLDLQEHLPGYQTAGLANADEQGWISASAGDLSYRYRIRNQGDRYPYFDDDKPVYLTPGVGITKEYLYGSYTEATYNVLPLNQTVTIPLFAACPDGTSFKDVTKFVLEYYVDFDTDVTEWDINGITSAHLQDFDILRWKLFGEPKDTDPGKPTRTEAISDFYPAREGDGPGNPVCIGSDISPAEDVVCSFPVAKIVDIGTDYPGDWETFQGDEGFIRDPESGMGGIWSQARECTTSDAGQAVAPGEMTTEGDLKNGIKYGCSIMTFMQNHRKNYLTLTNVVNPDIIGITDPAVRAAKANIFYRLAAVPDSTQSCPGEGGAGAGTNLMVRPYADISADGFALDGKVRQSIDAKLRLNSFLPVFNFTLFRTDPSKGNPEDQGRLSIPGSLRLP
jgi:hypothetical protein